MGRPREFDREAALDRAITLFWEKGFAATSTEELLDVMGIGRQSLYNAFGDKRKLYLEAISSYQRKATGEHLDRLSGSGSPFEGLCALLVGLVPEDDERRGLGCLGVGSVSEFGARDAELIAMREKVSPVLQRRLVERIVEGQRLGEIDPRLEPDEAASFVQITMTGLQTAARAGGGAEDLRRLARFAVQRLRAS